MPSYDPSQIRIAATGAFWKAPAGTVAPTDSTSAYGAGFVNLGLSSDAGFTITQNLKTNLIPAWQTTEPVRLLNSSLDRKINVESIESDKQNLSLAWGNATVTGSGVATGGAITIGTGGVLTTATAHTLTVGTPVQLGTVVTSTGISAGTTYWVVAVPTSTTLTLSATLGGAPLTTTSGTGTNLVPSGPYAIAIPDSAVAVEFVLGIDWSDGINSQRLIIPRATLLSLPSIKFTRTDAIRYPLEVQVLKPIDMSQSILPYGNDWAATA